MLYVLCCKGEIKVCELEKVFRYDTYNNEKSGQTGTLFITNFKVSFVTLKLDDSAEYVVGFSVMCQLSNFYPCGAIAMRG